MSFANWMILCLSQAHSVDFDPIMRYLRPILILLSAVVVILAAWFAPFDLPASERVDAGLKRALASFASARALNAVISMAQGTEISATPMGFGVVFTPGQVLDPVNDLIESFSHAMLAASVAFGVQKVLIGVGGFWPVSVLLTVVVAIGVGLSLYRVSIPPWLARVLLVLVLVRFAIPAVILGTDMFFEKFLAADYVANQQAIELAAGQIEKNEASVRPNDAGVLDRMKSLVNEKNFDVGTRLDELKKSAEVVTERVINLIVIFLLQTLVIPLLLLWALSAAIRSALERPAWSGSDKVV